MQNTVKNIPRTVYIRYFLFQLPGTVILISIMLLLQYYIGFDWFIFWIILIAWVMKDIIMFPFIWRSYDAGNNSSTLDMKGKVADVTRKLDPEGYVRIGGELWRARLMEDSVAEAGNKVKIEERDGLLLRVRKVQ